MIRSPFKELPREVSILVAASFFVAVGFGIVMPAIPVFAKSFGVNNAAIGLMVSGVYAVGKAAAVTPITFGLALVAFIVLVRTKVNPVLVIVATGILFAVQGLI